MVLLVGKMDVKLLSFPIARIQQRGKLVTRINVGALHMSALCTNGGVNDRSSSSLLF